MRASSSKIEDEFVCVHGHSVTPVGQLKIRTLREQAAAGEQLNRAEQLLVDIVAYGMSGRQLRSRVMSFSPRVAAMLERIEAERASKEAQDPRMNEVRRLIAARKLIPAIRIYREVHGCSLFEAKSACESMQCA